MNWRQMVWRTVQGWFSRQAPPWRTVRVEELPEGLAASTVYLVGEGHHLWSAALPCPCGCGETVQLNLLPDMRLRWRVIEHDDGTVSLYPSIWRRKGYRSHFFIRYGRIGWCKPKGGEDRHHQAKKRR